MGSFGMTIITVVIIIVVRAVTPKRGLARLALVDWDAMRAC